MERTPELFSPVAIAQGSLAISRGIQSSSEHLQGLRKGKTAFHQDWLSEIDYRTDYKVAGYRATLKKNYTRCRTVTLVS